ncbi:MAG: hypothetical protein JKY54_15445 [Flavobacteriales bacterium]|nr:hypothetical protein [Flavobacteriales bacterium]
MEGSSTSSGKDHVPASTDEEKLIVDVWSNLLKRNKIGMQDDFFELGGNSLKLIRLRNMYEQRFNLRLPTQLFYAKSTVQQHLELFRTKTNSLVNKTLIQLNTSVVSNKNIILVPPISGQGIMFKEFSAYLEGKINCFSINYDSNQNYNSIGELSAYFSAKFIEEVSPDRDEVITIMGYSMGATVAFEIVRLLEEQGFTCELLLIDRHPNEPTYMSLNVDYSEEQISQNVDAVLQAFSPQEMSEEEAAPIRKSIRHNFEVLESHRTEGVVKANILCVEGKNKAISGYMNAWSKYTKGEFRVTKIKASHYQIFDPKHFKLLAKQIEVLGKMQREMSVEEAR